MSILNAAIFGTIMAGAVIGLDYYLYTQKNAAVSQIGGIPYASYVDSVKQRIGSTIEVAAPEAGSLDAFLPEPSEGQSRRPYRAADGEAVTGRAYRHSMISVDTTNDLLRDLGQRRNEKTAIVETYSRGDERIVIQLTLGAPKVNKTFTDQIAAEIAQNVSAFGLGMDQEVFGAVKGVVFRQWAQTNRDTMTGQETPVDYRRFKADIGDSVDILVVTNAKDAEVQAVLGAIDMAGLAAKAGLTEAMVNNDRPVVWGKDAAPVEEASIPAAPPPEAPAVVVPRKADTGLVQTMAARKVAMPAQQEGVCVRRAGKLICE